MRFARFIAMLWNCWHFLFCYICNVLNGNRRKDAEYINSTGWSSSNLTLYDLQLEILDIILVKSYLHWILNSPAKPRNEEVITPLISVDVCFNRRITRRWFKKATWRYMRYVCNNSNKSYEIIRKNRNYLIENIDPSNELIATLSYLSCLTEEQSQFIRRQHSKRDQNAELLYSLEPFDETRLSAFVKCLRKTNQKTVAKFLENGGDVVKVKVTVCGTRNRALEKAKILQQKIENLDDPVPIPPTSRVYEIFWQMRKGGIEILNSRPLLDRRTVSIWIWCRSQKSLQQFQRMYESKQLKEKFFDRLQPSTFKIVNTNKNQFKKSVVVRPIVSISKSQRIEIPENESVFGVTKLQNKIYVLCQSNTVSHLIRVFEDRDPFSLDKNIELKESEGPCDIGSSETESCLYVSDSGAKCVWKITRLTYSEPEIIKWLSTEFRPSTFSVSSYGQLLLLNHEDKLSKLNIYRSDAELSESIDLPPDISYASHAVSASNRILISHSWNPWTKVKEREGRIRWREREMGWIVSSLTGHAIDHRFIPSDETQEMKEPNYLSLYSRNQVFVGDRETGAVILLDSKLKYNCTVVPIEREDEEKKVRGPHRLFSDEKNNQLIVGRFSGPRKGVSVYTLV